MKTMLFALLAGVFLLAGCQSTSNTTENSPPAGAPANLSAAPVAAVDWGLLSYGVELDLPIPLSAYQPVALQEVAASDTSYSALVPCPRDSAGALSVQIRLQPQRQSIEKLTLLYAGTSPTRKIKQIGNGIGNYNPKTRRYHFNLAYQTITELPNHMRRYSELYEIHLLVSTETNSASILRIRLAH